MDGGVRLCEVICGAGDEGLQRALFWAFTVVIIVCHYSYELSHNYMLG